MDINANSDNEETLNVGSFICDGPQPYNYEPVAHPRKQRETRGELMAKGDRVSCGVRAISEVSGGNFTVII